MDDDLHAQRSMKMEVAVEEKLGPTRVRAQAFYEDVHDHLGNAFGAVGSGRSLRIFNAGRLAVRGMGLTVSRQLGVVSGSMTYTYGHGWRTGQARLLPSDLAEERVLTFEEGDFHDLVARVETVITGTDTRLLALYRVNRLQPQGDEHAVKNSRFDVQLSQGLLDEVAVLNPPKRILGGIAVRF